MDRFVGASRRAKPRGTPGYMSPEVLGARAGFVVEIRGWEPDVWALGVMLFRLMTGGHFPFGFPRDLEEFVLTPLPTIAGGPRLNLVLSELLEVDHKVRPDTRTVLARLDAIIAEA